MRKTLPTAILLAVLAAPAAAGVKLGPIHQVSDNQRLELGWDYLETTHPDGGRIVVRVVDRNSGGDAIVLRRLAGNGADMVDSATLVEDVRYYSIALGLDEDGTVRASWFHRDTCKVGIATFDLDGRQKRRRMHDVDPVWCDSYAYIVRGVAGEWHLLQSMELAGEEAFRTLRYDWAGIGATREVTLSGRAAGQVSITPMLAIGPDGSIAAAWLGGHPAVAHARVWDANGDPVTGRIDVGLPPGLVYRGGLTFALDQGRFLLAFKVGTEPEQWIGRELVIGSGQPTTTTTTTLPPPSDLPELTHVTKLYESEQGSWWHSGQNRLAADGRGTWIASWNDWSPNGETALVAVSNNGGRTWGGAQALGAGSDVVVAADGEGNWLAGAADCAFRNPAECLWRFWRSGDDGRTWTSNYAPYDDQWADYLPRPEYGDFLYGSPQLISAGVGRWIFAVSARQDVSTYFPGDTLVLVARSDDDGAHWRWAPRPVGEYYGDPFDTVPGLVRLSAGSMALWKLDTFYGVTTDSADFDHLSTGDMLAPLWSEPGLARLYPHGFAAASDAEATIVATWASRGAGPQGPGWDPDVLFSRSGDSGQSWTSPQPISKHAFGDGAVDDYPAIATNRRGQWLAGWRSTWPSRDAPSPSTDVLGAYSSDDGQTWSPTFQLAPDEVLSAMRHRLDALQGTRRGWGALWLTQTDDVDSALWVSMTRPTGVCGDGTVSRSEDCDDGNLFDGDGCDSNCTATACGNGIVTAGEICDDGNLSSEDACSKHCRPTFCGDGVVRWDTEYCDDGNAIAADACKPDCTPAWCGDGIVANGREECDDQNSANGDGCDANCTVTRCGNGIVSSGEACDDGNTDNQDECLDDCTVAMCGDGFLHTRNAPCDHRWCPDPPPTEQCDDGNTADGDGCSSSCELPPCGDGIVHPGVEECDDGNRDDGDGCDFDCTLTGCGNGRVTEGEVCDDGNTADGDYCSSDCSGFIDGCGDADASGDVTASDASRVLGSAVGLQMLCPRWTCDANGSGAVTAVDGSMVLRKAVGLEVQTDCSDRIRVRLVSASLLGALLLRIDHRAAAGVFYGTPGQVRCTSLVPALSAFGDTGNELSMGFVSLEGIQGPVDLAECIFRRFAQPAGNEFAVFIDDASGPNSESPKVGVRISLVVE